MKNIFKHLKVDLLINDVIRFQYCPSDNFTNEESLFIKSKTIADNELNFINNNKISFTYNNFIFEFEENNPLSTLEVKLDNRLVYKYKEIKNSGELPLPNKTPIIFPLMDSPRLIIPSEGYTKNNSGYILQENVKDLYLLLSNNDYKKLRKQYISLTGENDLPRIKNFGLFSSRYFKYSQQSAMEMIKNYEKHKIPLDTFILDTDWRNEELTNGTGYSVNKELFPNINEFFRFAHMHNLQVMMNDHPLPLSKESTVLDEEEIDYRNSNLTKLYIKGLDGWWYDRNWICSLNSVSNKIQHETLGNYLFNDVTKQFNQGCVIDQDVYERNLVMNNIVDIRNGVYKGIRDSRSHTYSLQWTGDTASNEASLRNEIVNLGKCANNMIGYYSSDIGGHMGEPTKNQYIRWIQYGSLSPVLRPHCTCSVKKFREPWNYDKKTLEISRNYIDIRYKLLNSFYTAAYKNINSGLGICSPLYMHFPEDKKCYKEETTYMIGDSILVSPISGADKPHSVTKNNFVNKLRITIYPNKEFKGPKSYTKVITSFEDVSKFYKSVKRKNRKTKYFSFRFKGDLRFKKDYQLAISNEVGAKVYINNKEMFNDTEWHYPTFNEITSLKKNKTYSLKVEAVQPRKLQNLDIIYYRLTKNRKIKVYLPEGEWFNISHRNVYQGKRYIKEKYKLEDTPIFVKAGSLLALYKTLDNISKMSLKNIVYDYYTSKNVINNNFFYEDDGHTTAYRIGEYRKNEYKTYFNDGKYIIELKGNNKLLDDEIKNRNVIFKAHIRDNETIDRVLINGEPIKFKRHDHSKNVIPFLNNEFARDSKTLTFKFKQVIKDNYKIELVIRK